MSEDVATDVVAVPGPMAEPIEESIEESVSEPSNIEPTIEPIPEIIEHSHEEITPDGEDIPLIVETKEITAMPEETPQVAPYTNVSDASLYTPGDGHLEMPKLETNHNEQIAVVSAQLPFGHVQVIVKEQVACAWILKNVLGPLMADVDKNQP